MRIFISYAHDDTAKVIDVRRALDIHEVWFDHRLSVGQDWWNEIERQISACHCFLFVMSPASVASEYCQKEIEAALRLGKPVAPVMIAPMDIPDKIKQFQVISIVEGLSTENTAKLLNGLFEIERQIFNPMKASRGHQPGGSPQRVRAVFCDDQPAQKGDVRAYTEHRTSNCHIGFRGCSACGRR